MKNNLNENVPSSLLLPSPFMGIDLRGAVSTESHPHRSTRMREHYCASYAKALNKSCSPLCVSGGPQPRFGAELASAR